MKKSKADESIGLFDAESPKASPLPLSTAGERAGEPLPPPPAPNSPTAGDTGVDGRLLVMTEAEARSLTYEILDRAIACGRAEIDLVLDEHNKLIRHIEGCYQIVPNLTPPSPTRTRVWWCIGILREMEIRKLIRLRLRFSSHAVRSLLAADWIWARFEEAGVDFDET